MVSLAQAFIARDAANLSISNLSKQKVDLEKQHNALVAQETNDAPIAVVKDGDANV
jgi:hypothetical protein